MAKKQTNSEIKDIFCNINTGLLYNVLPPFAKKEIEWKASSDLCIHSAI